MSRGLVLTGGGARAAYQVGVLKGIASILPRAVYNPFPIICGTSAGAINALSIAGRAGPFRLRTKKLETIWQNLRASDVYRTDFMGVSANAFHVLASFLHSGYGIGRPISLLDNSPLRQLLDNYVKFDYLDTAITNGELEAIAVSAMSYASGQSVTFFQGHQNIEPWKRARRRGEKTALNIDHLMASTAIPSLFPAVQLNEGYFGDGAVRQLKPISPALHMGARQLLIIGVSDNATAQGAAPERHSPSIAQIVGHMFNSAFIDSIESDLETLRSINRLASALPESIRANNGITDLNPIDVLSISPSQSIDQIAQEHIHELPRSLKLFLRLTGATAQGGGTSAASYLLFEPGFCRKLIELGYQDALTQQDAIETFFED
ncbi:MAG: patatin-like phospholipase family protein [Porticoccaceae bacterium]